MNIREYVRKLMHRENRRDTPDSPEAQIQDADSLNETSSPLGIASLEGMSTATARFVIERNVPEDFADRWDVKELANKGRYYVARVVDPDGKLIDELLVDKQNGSVHFLKGRYRAN